MNCRFYKTSNTFGPNLLQIQFSSLDPSHPLGKRKEIDNVMKKARQAPPNEYWDKKLLEAEEKDPNRWKHTGYKKMYVNGVPRKSRSRSPLRKTPDVPPHRARNFPQSPVRRRMSRTPERYKPRSPPPRYPREMVKPKEMYRPGGKSRPMSPPPKVSFTSSSSSNSSLAPTSRPLAHLQSPAAQTTPAQFAAATKDEESPTKECQSAAITDQ